MYFILLCIELLNVCMWNVHNVNTIYDVYDVMYYIQCAHIILIIYVFHIHLFNKLS